MKESLSPRERIRKKKDFLILYKKGSRYRGKYFNLVFLPNNQTYSRMAVVVGKRVGNAVKRNKIKRWMRALYRRNKDLLEIPLDMIFLTKEEIAEASWAGLGEEYCSVLGAVCRKL